MDHVERSKLMDVTTKGASTREFDLGKKKRLCFRSIPELMEDGFKKKFRLNSSFCLYSGGTASRPSAFGWLWSKRQTPSRSTTYFTIDETERRSSYYVSINTAVVNDTADILFMIVQCDLHSEDGSQSCNLVYNPSHLPAETVTPIATAMNSTMAVRPLHEPAPTRNLTGQTIANACQLLDSDNKPGIFFVFPDLSVRTEGRFTLRFVLIDLSEGEPSTMSTRIKHQVFSNPFTVYSPKSFPGMRESTPLSVAFAKQGSKIAIRKGSRISRKMVEQYSASSTEPP
ncbi:hypothetical protein INT43_000031 [Umbelopsis isabellina]|uniref:Velvet domain-containing protein n=1 Tax=Mortierella isabellina TaxID=91625 RepID=A0A8H7PFG1_MORIS|nr:hypothetical protein INT43_000031 [Umbelopsis isabellina]